MDNLDKYIRKSEDCLMCVCLECNQKFGTDIGKCEHSDCQWCKGEIGEYTGHCRHYQMKEVEQ